MKKYKVCSNKQCIHKSKLQPLENFYQDKGKRNRNGLQYWCKDCSKKQAKEWKTKNPEKHKKSQRKWSEKNPEYSKNQYKKNPEYWKIYSKKNPGRIRIWMRKLIKNIFNHYGNKCIRCGENDIRVLDINHKKGGGTQHRKSIGGGSAFYIDIKKNNYPPEYNILCANCNWVELCEKVYKIPYLNKENFYAWVKSVSRWRKSTWKNKYKILEYYTEGKMKCTLCPQDDLRILTVDHIVPLSFSGEKRKRSNELIKKGFPSGIRILCRNCQRLAFLEWKQKITKDPNKRAKIEDFSPLRQSSVVLSHKCQQAKSFNSNELRQKMTDDS